MVNSINDKKRYDKLLFGGVPPLAISHQKFLNRYASRWARYHYVNDHMLFIAG